MKDRVKRRCLWVLIFWIQWTGCLMTAHAQDPPVSRGENEFLAIFYPIKNATLAAEVSGTVTRIAHDMGDAFRRGDSLVLLDGGHFRAETEKAEAAKTYAAAVYESKAGLYRQKSVSTVEYAKAEADYQIAAANLAIARKNLAACTIRAPYHGRVVKRLARENEFVAEGQPLLEIIDDSKIRVKCHLPAFLFPDIRVGQTVRVRARDEMPAYECRITHKSPVVESNTNSFQVFGEIDNSRGAIRAGMTGYILLESSPSDP